MNTNQHYVSQALLRRFTTNGRLHRYSIKYGKWDTTAPRSIFSRQGYNQLIAFGVYDDSIDKQLKTLEDNLPITLKALDDAATRSKTQFDFGVYDHLCRYCAFLWHMSPFSKVSAAVSFIVQLNMDLEHGRIKLLQTLGFKPDNIAIIQKLHADGYRFIITGKNFLQLVYRIQFAQKCPETYQLHRNHTKWTVFNSPIEFPISDMAFLKYHEQNANVMLCLLPISPQTVLVGNQPMGNNIRNSNETIVYGNTLPESEAEYIRNMICLSTVLTLASKSRLGDINAFRAKASNGGAKFVKLNNLDMALSAGLEPIESEQDFLITPVNVEQYKKFVHSSPPDMRVLITQDVDSLAPVHPALAGLCFQPAAKLTILLGGRKKG